MPYICRRQIYDQGKTYQSGDVVPAENWSTRYALQDSGMIAFVSEIEKGPEEEPVQTPSQTGDDGDNKTDEEKQAAQLMELSVEKLTAALKDITDLAVLNVIFEKDERKTAKEAVMAKIAELEG